MRAVKGVAAALILAALPLASAQAHVGWAIGINLGAPFYYRPYYPYPYYYYRPYPVYVAPPAVVVQPAPVLQPAYSSPAEAAPATAPTPPPAPAPLSTPAAAQPAAWAPDGAEAQLQRLNSADDQARADAAVQLGRMKAMRAVQPLERLLSGDRSAAVRDAAARGLGLIGSPDALPALQRAAQADDDRDVRHSAQFAAEVIRSGMPR